MPGKSQVIITGIVDQLAAVPADGAGAHPVARLEEGDRDAAPRDIGEAPFQIAITGEPGNEAALFGAFFLNPLLSHKYWS